MLKQRALDAQRQSPQKVLNRWETQEAGVRYEPQVHRGFGDWTFVSSCFPSRYLQDMALEAVSTATFKTALFCLIIDTVNYSRNKWLAGKQQLAGINEMAKSSP